MFSIDDFIFTAPPVISPMPNVTKIENDGASLVCEAYGDPAPALAWIKALTGAQISESDASKVSSVSLVQDFS